MYRYPKGTRRRRRRIYPPRHANICTCFPPQYTPHTSRSSLETNHLLAKSIPPATCSPTMTSNSLIHPKACRITPSAGRINIVPQGAACVAGRFGPTAYKVEQYCSCPYNSVLYPCVVGEGAPYAPAPYTGACVVYEGGNDPPPPPCGEGLPVQVCPWGQHATTLFLHEQT